MPPAPKAVVIAFFPAFSPPSSGGEMRLGSLYREVARDYDVTLLTSTDFGARFERIVHAPRFTELRFPKDTHWRKAYATLDAQGLSGDLSGLAFALAVSEPQCELRQTARRLAETADLVIHEFAFSEPIFDDGCPVPEIYNAHNVEASLIASIAQGSGTEAAFLKVLRMEGNLVARAERVFAASPADRETFRLFYGATAGKLAVCPNGFDPAEFAELDDLRALSLDDADRRPRLLFTGSGHPPNVAAGAFLFEAARALPECDIVIAGGVCGALQRMAKPDNLTLFGSFDARQKLELLAEADLYLNPVVSGSGTSLKALEALGAGLPMVATPEGIRGLDLEDGRHASITPLGGFAAEVRRLLADPERRLAIAEAGVALAQARFTWQGIAQRLVVALRAPVEPSRPAAPILLAFNDYAIDGVLSGGAARVRGLLGNLGRDVVLVTFGQTYKMSLLVEGFLTITVAKADNHREFQDAVNDGQRISADDVVAALFVGASRSLSEIVARLLPRAGAVIFEHPFMAPLIDQIEAARPDIPIVYSAHNVETEHKARLLGGHPASAELIGFVGRLESKLLQSARLVVACTSQDVEAFAASGATATLAANGSQMAPAIEKPRTPGEPRWRVGFLGSSHPPNVTAAEFIVAELAPLFPDVVFEFIGGVCEALAGCALANVSLWGMVVDSVKTDIMQRWDLGLNPIVSGGGSSLKLPDFMAHGLPTLNTPAGARGFPVVGAGLGRVEALAEFAPAMRELLHNKPELARLSANARRYAAQHLAWPSVADDYRKRLTALLARPRHAPGRKLLVVTYRYTEPPLGGAEEYLIETLKRLRPRYDRIDLAAIDTGSITNRHHFGCEIGAGGGAATRLGDVFDRARYFPMQAPSEETLLSDSRLLEREWNSEEFDLMEPFAEALADSDRLRLFAGFYAPEVENGLPRRWTGPVFTLLAPTKLRILRLRGFAGREKTLTLTLLQARGDGALHEYARFHRPLPLYFELFFALPEAGETGPVFVMCEVDEHSAEGDHRPFGVLLTDASSLNEEMSAPFESTTIRALSSRNAELGEVLQDKLREERLEDWIDALVDVARQRRPEAEAAFASARGPHSPALQSWLADNAGEYDTILVQGVPFDVVPRTVETLTGLPDRPRLVVLPHFHGDDRFYHWNRYYEAFRGADRTLLFSEFLADRLSPRDKFAIVPGGGVRLDEPANPAVWRRFRDLTPTEKPFFLVLGRKTGSKGYQSVIAAHRRIRKSGFDVDLLLIGPDDDGMNVEGEGVFYLGRQPREVVLGALSDCLALVSMSASESFGIVLCEAWLFHKPVIANRRNYAFRGLVRDGETGILVGTDDELDVAMRRLSVDDRARARMGEAGFAEVTTRYSWEGVAEAIDTQLSGDEGAARSISRPQIGAQGASISPRFSNVQ